MGTLGLTDDRKKRVVTTRWEQSRKAAIGFILDQVGTSGSLTRVASRVVLAGSACVGASVIMNV